MTPGFWRGWGGLAVVALAAFLFGQWLRSDNGTVDVGGRPDFARIAADRDAPEEGPADADVTIIVFTDYRCPLCRVDAPALARAVARDGRVRISYRDWPVLGPESLAAARVALAARAQGRYPAVHRALMAAERLDEAGLVRAVAEAGADWAGIERALDQRAVLMRLARNGQDAAELGLPGTPAYLVGTTLAVGRQGESGFARLIARARAAAR